MTFGAPLSDDLVPRSRRTSGIGALRLAVRVIGWQVLFSLGTAGVLVVLPPFLLLLSGTLAVRATESVVGAVLVAGILAVAYSWLLVRRRRQLVRSLVVGTANVDQLELPKLNDDPWNIVIFWVGCTWPRSCCR